MTRAVDAKSSKARVEARRLLDAIEKSWPDEWNSSLRVMRLPEGVALRESRPAVRAAAALEVFDEMLKPAAAHRRSWFLVHWGEVLNSLLRQRLPFTPEEGEELFARAADPDLLHNLGSLDLIPFLARAAEHLHERKALTPAARTSLARIADTLAMTHFGEGLKVVNRILDLVGARPTFGLDSGEAWSDRATACVAALAEGARPRWIELFDHARRISGGRPNGKWETRAADLLQAVGAGDFQRAMVDWLPLLDQPRTQRWPSRHWIGEETRHLFSDANIEVLRGLIWMCAPAATPDICRALGRACESAMKKLPSVGPRAPKLANACVHVLGRIGDEHALGQLARLKSRVRSRSTLNLIERALDAVAERRGLTREDLEELGVPTYSFDKAGRRAEAFGGVKVELSIAGSKVVTTWTNEKGKAVKSPPAAVKTANGDALKAMKGAAADAEKALTAQRDRLDGLMAVPRRWKFAEWRQRHLDHPLVGALARRLIWTIDGTATFFNERDPASDVDGVKVETSDEAEVEIWRPVGRPAEEVVAWRRRLEALGVTQPFKQAHREVYVLTDAERATRVYSNRFAAHILRQHQFNALCGARGWKNKLRLMVDDVYPPASKELSAFGLRAEFWIEGVGEQYEVDTNAAGVFLRLVADQVRFYRIDAARNTAHAAAGGYGAGGQDRPVEPLPLEDVPPLAFSEIMRDVDLFVGVASVGNDPTWQDGGPQGRFRDYWADYSFGELGESAKTRRAALERLVPRLKIADRCALTERFLIVRGDLRTYKIHLGSGNILMEPNDQYLCIVPARGVAAGRDGEPLHLPFEGDATLSIILSKAFLLAADVKITDPTIVRQIRP